ncbi:YeeE/YedE family protein [Leptospira licerasiae]|uniref:YeeE/YedE family protein n=1 Tax=Leptospira licerasiae TaxID=447106 RepID=UPI00108376C5|nr:YeeE/YedE family protein [Leptospira licerasiae]TGM94973.1 YeeE/YedE family protein [Leptospira licerasiae]
MSQYSSPHLNLEWKHYAGFFLVSILLFCFSYYLNETNEYGRDYSFSALAGGALGFLMQRSRFCFFCNFKDFLIKKESSGLLGILTAIAISTLGYSVVFGAWIPDPNASYLPPNAFIAPVHIHLLLGGLAFGFGMSLSGSCISGHLYRIGEGSFSSWFAIIGSGVGFILGFVSWNFIFIHWVSEADIIWLPKYLGYGLSTFIILGILFVLAVWISKKGKQPYDTFPSSPDFPKNIIEGRWPSWIGGIGVGILSFVYYLRVRPIGVTSELGRLSRELGNLLGIIPTRLEGLDTISGCITSADGAKFFTINAVFVLSLVLGSFGSALGSKQFSVSLGENPTFKAGISFFGGIFLGWGAMVSIGCTFGTFFSGISAHSLSGFVFAIGLIPGILAGLVLLKIK